MCAEECASQRHVRVEADSANLLAISCEFSPNKISKGDPTSLFKHNSQEENLSENKIRDIFFKKITVRLIQGKTRTFKDLKYRRISKILQDKVSALPTRTNDVIAYVEAQVGSFHRTRPSPKKALLGSNDRLNTLAKPDCQSTSQRSTTNVIGINFMSDSLSRIDATTESPRNRWEPDSSRSRFQRNQLGFRLRYRWLSRLLETSFEDDAAPGFFCTFLDHSPRFHLIYLAIVMKFFRNIVQKRLHK